MPRGSFPYMIVLAALTLGICVYLWVILDVAAVEIMASPTWGNGSTHAIKGQERIANLWRYGLMWTVTGIAFTLILSARRGL